MYGRACNATPDVPLAQALLSQCYPNGTGEAVHDARRSWMGKARGRGHVIGMMMTSAADSAGSAGNGDRRRTSEGQGYREVVGRLLEEVEEKEKEMSRQRKRKRNDEKEEEQGGRERDDDDGEDDDDDSDDEESRKKDKKVTEADSAAESGGTVNNTVISLFKMV